MTEFDELYEKTFCGLRRYIALRCADPFDVPDLLQEVYLEYLRTAARRGSAYASDPEALLYAIAKRKSAKAMAKHVKKCEQPLDEAEELAEPDFSDEAIERCDAAALSGMVAKLPEEMRKALYLRFAEQLPLEEIAAASGWGLSKVKHLLYGALERLRSEADSGGMNL